MIDWSEIFGYVALFFWMAVYNYRDRWMTRRIAFTEDLLRDEKDKQNELERQCARAGDHAGHAVHKYARQRVHEIYYAKMEPGWLFSWYRKLVETVVDRILSYVRRK